VANAIGSSSYYGSQKLYYSNCDFSVYGQLIPFDNRTYRMIELAPILMIQWSVLENVEPIYGFREQWFRRVAHGSRVVAGQFQIPFEMSAKLRVKLYELGSPTDELGSQKRLIELMVRPWREVRAQLQAGAAGSGQVESEAGSETAPAEEPEEGSVEDQLRLGGPQRKYLRQLRSRALDRWPFPGAFNLYIFAARRAGDPFHPGVTEPLDPARSYMFEQVEITQVESQIDTSGQAVTETYQFLASRIRMADTLPS